MRFVLSFFLVLGTLMAAEPAELTKDEALNLMNLQFQIVAAEADLKDLYAQRAELVKQLAGKYKVDTAVMDLDIAHGRFVPKKEKQDAPKDK